MLAGLAKSLKSVVAHTHITGKITAETTQKLERDLSKLWWRSPKMIAVSINSSHGSIAQAELIVKKLKSASDKFDCPIYTFAQDTALGPGYYILSAGNKVFADAHSLIGNIAISSSHIGLTEFSKQFQITQQNVVSGKNKVRLSPFEKVKPEDEAWIKAILEDKANLFKKYVLETRGHKIPRNSEVEKKIFSGDSFTAKKAIEFGLVDLLGEVHSVVEKEYSGTPVKEFLHRNGAQGPQYEILLMKLRDGAISQEQFFEELDSIKSYELSNRMHYMV